MTKRRIANNKTCDYRGRMDCWMEEQLRSSSQKRRRIRARTNRTTSVKVLFLLAAATMRYTTRAFVIHGRGAGTATNSARQMRDSFCSPCPDGMAYASRWPRRSNARRMKRLEATNSRELRFWGEPNTDQLTGFQNIFSAELVAAAGQCSAMLSAASTVEAAIASTSAADIFSNGIQYRRLSSMTGVAGGKRPSNHSPDDESSGKSRLPAGIPKQGYGTSIQLSDGERDLFHFLRKVRRETELSTTLRVAGGWVRDKLLATEEFRAYHKVFEVGSKSNRLTSKFLKKKSPPGSVGGAASMGRLGTKVVLAAANTEDDVQPVDIDIALDDMLGREFADHLNQYLSSKGKDTVNVGVVLKNPEKSKHLETATMKVDSFWIDLVNLRAEEYTQDSRIPDLMRIGTAAEDAFRRDLTINALFYNINTGQVEDWTGRGFDDLRKGIVATPLAPLTTLLDDPLRVLRSVRFAARLRFTMAPELVEAARDDRVRYALAQKVSRERVGGEVDLMLRSPDPVGAMRLLVNLNLADTVFPIAQYLANPDKSRLIFHKGLGFMSTAHDHMADCRYSPPLWCVKKRAAYGYEEVRLIDDDEARRMLWYASFLKPLWDDTKLNEQARKSKRQGRKANRSVISKLLVGELKRPVRDAEAVERIIRGADDFTHLLNAGCDISATMILLSDVRVTYVQNDASGEKSEGGHFVCSMNGRQLDSTKEDDPVWEHAMEFRLLCSKVIHRAGPLWRAALFLSIAEQLRTLEDELEYVIEGDFLDESQEARRHGIIERFDTFATALQHVGLIGIWNEKPLLDGRVLKEVLPGIPKGPAFREVMDEQVDWMTAYPGGQRRALEEHLKRVFPDFAAEEEDSII